LRCSVVVPFIAYCAYGLSTSVLRAHSPALLMSLSAAGSRRFDPSGALLALFVVCSRSVLLAGRRPGALCSVLLCSGCRASCLAVVGLSLAHSSEPRCSSAAPSLCAASWITAFVCLSAGFPISFRCSCLLFFAHGPFGLRAYKPGSSDDVLSGCWSSTAVDGVLVSTCGLSSLSCKDILSVPIRSRASAVVSWASSRSPADVAACLR